LEVSEESDKESEDVAIPPSLLVVEEEKEEIKEP
jgi:hypothetical protein